MIAKGNHNFLFHTEHANVVYLKEAVTGKQIKDTYYIAVRGSLDIDAYTKLTGLLYKADKTKSCKYVKMHINSGGGAVIGAFECAMAIKQFPKPIIAYSDEMIASAAYLLGCSTDYLYTSPSAAVGSIGVRVTHVSVAEGLKKMGVDVTIIAEKDSKVMLSPERPLEPKAEEYLKERVKMRYNQFVSYVKSVNNKINSKAFSSLIYDGSEALQLGMTSGIIPNIYKFV